MNDQLKEENSGLNARVDKVEEEKYKLNSSIQEKIPECPVNIKLYFTLSDKFLNVLFLRFVLSSSRRTVLSTAAPLVTTSVDLARLISR